MKTKNISLLFTLFLSINYLHAQTINFTYDENGNRTTRTLYTEQLRSISIQFPVINPKDLQRESMKEKITEGELATYVYPNPNRGLIKIDVTYLPLNAKTEARIYDLSGTERLVVRNFENYAEIDISRFKDGVYILRIKINDSVFDWKIIKSSN